MRGTAAAMRRMPSSAAAVRSTISTAEIPAPSSARATGTAWRASGRLTTGTTPAAPSRAYTSAADAEMGGEIEAEIGEVGEIGGDRRAEPAAAGAAGAAGGDAAGGADSAVDEEPSKPAEARRRFAERELASEVERDRGSSAAAGDRAEI